MTRQRKSAAGFRSLATMQTLVRGAKPRERHQVANRYARLENERARLEREVGMWEACRRAAVAKLEKVHAEIDLLRPLLVEVPAKKAVHRRGRGQRRTPASTDVAGPSPARVRSMPLEY
jgi:hypothetical protein